jgi:threonine dehydratase
VFDLPELEAAARLVARHVPPTPTHAWPLLARRFGTDIVVKHENHTPVGAFKVRGGVVFMERLKRERPNVAGVISATRGNHGQSLAFAGKTFGVKVVIVAPHGNSREKNAAMAALGAELIEHGRDFDEAREEAGRIAAARGYDFVPSFHSDLVKGVATYALEMFRAHSDIRTVYAPIGLGSGICGVVRVRDLLGLDAEVVGVVAENAPAYALSWDAGRVIETNRGDSFADGMAVRIPSPAAFEMIRHGAARIVRTSEDEMAEAIRILHEDTHNMAEGAGAAPLAALAKDQARRPGKAAVVVSGGNIDRDWAATALAGGTPVPR